MIKTILCPFVLVFALFLAGAAHSAQISNTGKQFNACTDSADGEVTISEDGSSSTCCSKTLGYCMSCSHISCVKIPYSNAHPEPDIINRPIAPNNAAISPAPKPPALRDQIKRPQSTTLTPAKAVMSSKEPTVGPTKKHQASIITPTTSKAIRQP